MITVQLISLPRSHRESWRVFTLLFLFFCLYHLYNHLYFSGAAQRSMYKSSEGQHSVIKSLRDKLSPFRSTRHINMSYLHRDEKHIRDTCNILQLTAQLTTLPPSFFFISVFFHLFFRHLLFSAKCELKAARYFRTTNSSWRSSKVEKINTLQNREREIRALIDRSRSRKVYDTFVASKKRSMSLLADSWRSTEPSTLKRKLNEISNRQELPRIGPIKPPPVPRTCTRVY